MSNRQLPHYIEKYLAQSSLENMFKSTLNEFLESSTIHGVSYLAKRNCYVKFFWIFIIFTGFILAGYLIHESFKSWEESPVKTTIETLPISKMTWPNVTVCPPKHTYTDLNDDLVRADGMILSQEDRKQLIDYAIDLLIEERYNDIMKNLSYIQEENQYKNWYMGFTEIDLPEFFTPYLKTNAHLQLNIWTTAISGNISTLDFGEPFNPSKVPCAIIINVVIEIPESVRNSEKTSLIIKIKRSKMSEISEGKDSLYMDIDRSQLIIETFSKNFTPPAPISRPRRIVTLDRFVSRNDVNRMNLRLMPGFVVTWYYSEDLEPIDKFSHDGFPKAQMFRRYIHLIYIIKIPHNFSILQNCKLPTQKQFRN